jgi:hypothetical protein
MLQVPAVVAKFLLEGSRTAKEVYDFVSELTLEADAVLTIPDVDFIKTWLLVAGQYDSSGSNTCPKIALDLQPIITQNEVFHEWAEGVRISNIGAADAQKHQGTPPQQEQQQQQATALQQQQLGMAHQLGLLLQYMAQQEACRQQSTAEKPKKGATWTKFKVARLCGLAELERYCDLPPIWNESLESNDPDDHHTMLMSRMEAWYRQERRKMPKGLYFTKEQMKQIVATKFLPGGAIGVPSTAMEGLSNLTLPRSISAIHDQQRLESLLEEAKGNLTLKEIQHKDKGLQRQPPSMTEELTANTEATCALIHSLLGENDLCTKLYSIFMVLNGDYIESMKGTFKPDLIRDWFWAIFEEMREFFNASMTPGDFFDGTASQVSYFGA